MGKLFIESNTKGKTLKMLEGKTFESPLTFITELIQNTQRAKAGVVEVYVNDNTFVIKDNGKGLKKAQTLLTFDYSEWKSTSEGFGIGFWSILGIPHLQEIFVKSNNFILSTTRDNIVEDLSFNIEEISTMKGFEVTLVSDYFIHERDTIIDTLKNELKLMSFDSYVNGEYVTKVDVKDYVSGIFMMDFDNHLFSARLAVSPDCYDYPTYYYEKRKVCTAYNANFIKGVIELKKVDLKEPDRKAIVYNEKRNKMEKKLKDCISILYKEFVKTIGQDNDLLTQYEEPISNLLSVKDYDDCLLIDEKPKSKKQKSKQSTIIDTIKEVIEPDNEEEIENIQTREVEETIIDDEQVNEKPSNEESNEEENKKKELISYKKESVSNLEPTTSSNLIKRQGYSIKDFVRQNKNLVYINSNEVNKYQEAIGLSEYYGLKVYICQNKLYENFFIEKNVPHISDIESGIKNTYNFIDEGCKNNKEINFIQVLMPIVEKFNLPKDLFTIAEIEKEMEVVFDEKVLLRNKIKNKKDNIQIFAVKQCDKIVFDRRAINLKSFSIKEDNIGIHELRAIMYNVNTIAHELAHYIYGTQDNTSHHFKMENYLQQEIIKLYCLV